MSRKSASTLDLKLFEDNSPEEPLVAPEFSRRVVELGRVAPGFVDEAETEVDEVENAWADFSGDIFAAFERFLRFEVAEGDAADDTLRAYHREIEFYVAWCAQHEIDVASATRSHIEGYRAELKGRGLNVTTRSHKLSIVRRFYDAAVRAQLRPDNPAQGVRGGKDLTPGEEKIKSLTSAALTHLAEAIPGDSMMGLRDRAIVALMAVHGLRRVEVERLDDSSLRVEGEAASLEVHGKGQKVRHIFLRPDTLAILKAYLDAKKMAGFPPGGPFFISFSNRSRGERISRRSLNDIVDFHLSAANLKRVGVSCHALRHTFGNLAVEGGAPLEQLRDAMGHGQIETTELYVKAVARVKENPANFIDVDF